jgi:hypothetical protein
LGVVTLNLQCGGLKSPTKFYVIDAETSYQALLIRPWLHNNQIISSTLHQCLKYVNNDRQKRINGDLKPFGVYEIKFNDPQFFLSKEGKEKGKPSELVKTLRNIAPTEGLEYDAY